MKRLRSSIQTKVLNATYKFILATMDKYAAKETPEQLDLHIKARAEFVRLGQLGGLPAAFK